jgi:hypothetical protein
MGVMPQGLIQEPAVESDEIQVDGAGGVFIAPANTAQLRFQGQEDVLFEDSGFQGRPDQQGGIEKIGVVRSDRRGFPDRRAQHNINQLLQTFHGQRQIVFRPDI